MKSALCILGANQGLVQDTGQEEERLYFARRHLRGRDWKPAPSKDPLHLKAEDARVTIGVARPSLGAVNVLIDLLHRSVVSL
jgi:hypothetical protein